MSSALAVVVEECSKTDWNLVGNKGIQSIVIV